MSDSPFHVTTKQLAEVLGYSVDWIRKLQDKGMPGRTGTANKTRWDIREAVPWFVKYEVNDKAAKIAESLSTEDGIPDEAVSKARKAHYEAEQGRLDYEERQNNTVTVEDAERVIQTRLAQVKQALDTLPFKWAPFLLNVADAGQMQSRLQEQTNLMIQTLQQLPDDDDEEQEPIA